MADTRDGARAQTITTPDGRSLDVLDAGGDGLALLYHSGTPGGAVSWPLGIEAARRSGLRWVTYGRPGYGSSTPHPDRTVADAAADSAAVLDALGIGEFVTFGWSGGGPHALACAALLPDRCLGAATIAGAAPSDNPDLDFVAGMGEDNIEEFTLASKGREVLAPALEEMAEPFRSVTGEQIVDAMGGLLSAPDLSALQGPLAEYVAAMAREAVRVGVEAGSRTTSPSAGRGASTSTPSRSRSPCGRAARTSWCRRATGNGSPRTYPAPGRTCSGAWATSPSWPAWTRCSTTSSRTDAGSSSPPLTAT